MPANDRWEFNSAFEGLICHVAITVSSPLVTAYPSFSVDAMRFLLKIKAQKYHNIYIYLNLTLIRAITRIFF